MVFTMKDERPDVDRKANGPGNLLDVNQAKGKCSKVDSTNSCLAENIKFDLAKHHIASHVV
jgi:hypothetical protein